MLDIFAIPLYYISFGKNASLENYLKDQGFIDINHFEAIDGKQFSPDKLREDNLITNRAYNDLITGRIDDAGIPSLGAIGCTMSHYELWKKCLSDNIPYITIVENDLIFKVPPKKVEKTISADLTARVDSLFIGVKVQKLQGGKIIKLIGSQFYIASNYACSQLVANAFPIDIQTDWYKAELATSKKIYITGLPISSQKLHDSKVQSICIPCVLPKKLYWYLIVLALLIFILYKLRKKCPKIDCKI